MATDNERKRAQRERDRKSGLVRYERRIRPEWAEAMDRCLDRLQAKYLKPNKTNG